MTTYFSALLALATVICLFLGGLPLTLERTELRRLSQKVADSQKEPPDPSIVLVGLDDAVFKANRYNRLEHARVIDRLSQAGAKAIFLDIIFDEPRGAEFDVPLAEAIARSRRVIVAGFYREEASLKPVPPTFFPQLAELVRTGVCRVGLINTSHQENKAETLLAVNDNPQQNPYGSGLKLSAAGQLYALSRHLSEGDVEAVAPTSWHGDMLNLPPLRLEVNRFEQGQFVNYLIPLYYHPPATGPEGQPGAPGRMKVIPYLKIADGDPQALAEVKGKYIIIGDNRTGQSDLFRTPVGEMKGMEIHAQAFDSLLHNRIPRYPLQGTQFLNESLALITLLCLVLNLLLQRQPSLLRCLLVGVLGLAGWEAMVGWSAGNLNYLPRTLGEICLATTFATSMLVRLLITARILRTFIPAAIVEQLIKDVQIHQGEIFATVMVTDIRGYTTLSESRTPTQVLDLLNDYHTETVTLYQQFGGHVLNYQGDAQIILFGHPNTLKDAPRQAILAAQAASSAVETLRKRWKLPPDQAFNVGAGICTGKLIIADLGGMHREYTVIGELVRKCHKLQSQSQILKANIILDEETFERCQNKPVVEKRENVTIDGLPEPVTVYITDLVPD